jgi:hypothetical protein
MYQSKVKEAIEEYRKIEQAVEVIETSEKRLHELMKELTSEEKQVYTQAVAAITTAKFKT